MLLCMTVLTGLIYPLAITGVAQLVFPKPANGSLIVVDGQVLGSTLIGQAFTSPEYFWSRPSDTSPFPYNTLPSAGTNYAPTNPAYLETVQARVAALQAAEPGNDRSVPVDLVTGSGSGLDPHISLASAYYQVDRVAAARGLPRETVLQSIDQFARGRWLGIFGEPIVNVLALNLALDQLQ